MARRHAAERRRGQYRVEERPLFAKRIWNGVMTCRRAKQRSDIIEDHKYIQPERNMIVQAVLSGAHGLIKNIDTMSEMRYIHIDTKSKTRMGIRHAEGSLERTAARKEEIVDACEQLYRTMSFREITLKEIGSITSFSRPTIYNYFETKEEIFLALFKREYDRWNAQLLAILEENDQLTKAQLADRIAQSLAERQQLLKLLSMNNYDMEANSRQELLTIFKQSYGRSLELMNTLLEKFCPEMSAADIRNFIYTFFPFMFGIYPYAEVTDKQKAAMQEAGIEYVYQTVYELTNRCLLRLLGE